MTESLDILLFDSECEESVRDVTLGCDCQEVDQEEVALVSLHICAAGKKNVQQCLTLSLLTGPGAFSRRVEKTSTQLSTQFETRDYCSGSVS